MWLTEPNENTVCETTQGLASTKFYLSFLSFKVFFFFFNQVLEEHILFKVSENKDVIYWVGWQN